MRLWNVCGKKTRIQAFQSAVAVWWALTSTMSCTSVSAFWNYVNCVWNTWILIILQIHIWLHWRSHASKYVYNHFFQYWSVNNWTDFILTVSYLQGAPPTPVSTHMEPIMRIVIFFNRDGRKVDVFCQGLGVLHSLFNIRWKGIWLYICSPTRYTIWFYE